MKLTWCFFAFLATATASVSAQAPLAHPEAPPTLSESQRIALQDIKVRYASVTEAIHTLQTDIEHVAAEVAADHPGWHLDRATLRVVVGKDEQPTVKK